MVYDRNIKDSFIDSLGEVEKINLEREEDNNKVIRIRVKNGEDVLVAINDENQIIWMLDSKKERVSLSSCSQIVKALLKMKNQTNKRIYFPKEIL